MEARWLYHLMLEGPAPRGEYAPASLATEGFVHASYRDAVVESARLYFPPGARLMVLRIDPRKVGCPLVEADTPRGKMPHVHGAIPEGAIVGILTLEEMGSAPDTLT